MPKFKVSVSYGYVGAHWEDVIEADTEKQAADIAWEMACEQVDCSVQLVGDDGEPIEDE